MELLFEPLPEIRTPALVLPEMMLASSAAGPPIVLLVAACSRTTPSSELATAAVPATLSPMVLPRI